MDIYCLNGLNIKEMLWLEGFSQDFIHRHWVKWHFLISAVIHKKSQSFNDKITLYTKLMRKALGETKSKIPHEFKSESSRTYLLSIIRKTLKKWGVMWSHTTYYQEEGVTKAKVEFKIMDEWNVGYAKYNGNVPKPLADFVERDLEQTYEGVYGKLHESFLNINIDKESAIAYLDSLLENPSLVKLKDKRGTFGRWEKRVFNESVYSEYRLLVEEFESKRFFNVSARTGRIYSSLSNFPKILRGFLVAPNRERLVEVDVTNCQPMLLNQLGRTDEIYREVTEKGTFYNHIKEECIKRGIKVTDNFKIDLFTEIFFGNNHVKRISSIEKLFQELFPQSYFLIRDIKRNDHSILAVKLQELEAKLIMEGVCKELYESKVETIATIHDSVLVPESQKEIAEVVMERHVNLLKD